MSAAFSERDMSLEFCFSKEVIAHYMKKSVYDADGDGVVDNAARLGGCTPDEFARASALRGIRIANVSLTAEGGLDFLMEDGTHFYTACVRGENGKDGKDGKDGANGKDGTNGADGIDGVDGYTPVRGVDYFTESDIADIVARVVALLPESSKPEVADLEVSVDERGMVTVRTGLNRMRSYMVEVFEETSFSTGGAPLFSVQLDPKWDGENNCYFDECVLLRDLFKQNGVPYPDINVWLIVRVTGDTDSSLTPVAEADASWTELYEYSPVEGALMSVRVTGNTIEDWYNVCNTLIEGEQYFIEDALFTAIMSEDEGYLAPLVGTTFTGEDGQTYTVSAHSGPGICFSGPNTDRLRVSFYRAEDVGVWDYDTLCDTTRISLEAGAGYLVNDVFFVAEQTEYGYVAPPMGTRVKCIDNEIEVYHLSDRWEANFFDPVSGEEYVQVVKRVKEASA